MSIHAVSRADAFGLNPFISDLHTEDTLERCANTLRTLALLIATDPGGISLEPLHTVYDVICTAMEWESQHVTLAQGANHV